MGLEILILFWSAVAVMMMMMRSDPKLFPRRSTVYRSPVMFLDRWYSRFTNFDSIIPVDVIREKSFVNSFLESSGVLV